MVRIGGGGISVEASDAMDEGDTRGVAGAAAEKLGVRATAAGFLARALPRQDFLARALPR
jgi:hypothetical protein